MPLDLHIEYVLLLCLPFLVHNHYFTLPVHHLPQSSSSCLGLLAGQRKRIKAFFPRFPPRKKRPCCCHLTTSTSVGNRYLYRSELLPERPRSGPSTRLAAVLGLVNGRSAERRRETPSSYGGRKSVSKPGSDIGETRTSSPSSSTGSVPLRASSKHKKGAHFLMNSTPQVTKNKKQKRDVSFALHLLHGTFSTASFLTVRISLRPLPLSNTQKGSFHGMLRCRLARLRI